MTVASIPSNYVGEQRGAFSKTVRKAAGFGKPKPITTYNGLGDLLRLAEANGPIEIEYPIGMFPNKGLAIC